jgi:hypothetical protein
MTSWPDHLPSRKSKTILARFCEAESVSLCDANEKLTAFMEFETAIRAYGESTWQAGEIFSKLGVAKQIWNGRRMTSPGQSSPSFRPAIAGLIIGRKKKDQYESINPVQNDSSKQSDSLVAFDTGRRNLDFGPYRRLRWQRNVGP